MASVPLTESIVRMPIINPETDRASRTFEFLGKVDLIEGRRVVDWKGTSNPDRFISEHRISFQAELYALALRHQGVEIDEIEYRLITRPTIQYSRPKRTWAVRKATRKTAVKICDTFEEAEKLAKMQGGFVEERVTGDATRQAYEDRCLDWLIADSSKLVTHVHSLTESRLNQARWFVWENTKRLLENRTSQRWLPNARACFGWQRACEYLPICEAMSNGADVEWVIEDQYKLAMAANQELGGVTSDLDIVTYSSLSTLTECELMYFWKHERTLRKIRDEDSDALWTGSAMHAGVEHMTFGGEYAAFSAIDKWADANPIIGEDAAWKQDQQVARARAMVRAAAMKWPTTVADISRDTCRPA